MFSELPKLFDRKFALGFFLPGALFLVANIYIISVYNLYPNITDQLMVDLLVGTTTIGLLSWLVGIMLLGANRSIYRILEGYGKYNPLKWLLKFEKRKYERLANEIATLDEKYRTSIDSGEEFPLELQIRRKKLMEEIVEKYPDRPEWLLPTSFGNTIRAFEVYPRVVYGIESIQGWNRLLAVIPKDYQELIEDAKSQADFWINLSVLNVVLLIEYVGLAIYFRKMEAVWLPLIAIGLIIIAYSRAENAAVQWGELIKSSFDVFLPKLQQELGLSFAARDTQLVWTKFSQAIIYRLPIPMTEIKSLDEDNSD